MRAMPPGYADQGCPELPLLQEFLAKQYAPGARILSRNKKIPTYRSLGWDFCLRMNSYNLLTLTAWGPFGPFSTSKVT